MRLVLAIAFLVACDRPREPAAIAPQAMTAERPRVDDLIEKFQCNRCHDVPNTEPAGRDKHCVRCHQQIHAGTFDAKPDTLARWRDHIQSLRDVPSLIAATRLQRAWVKEFLLRPHDVRPGSIAQMPRLAISDVEADRFAAFLVPSESASVAFDPTLVAQGEQLYRRFACARCHRFTGASADDAKLHAAAKLTDEMRRRSREVETLAVAWTLAPDLRFARARLQPGSLAAWIEKPGGAMPAIAGVGPAEARALAAFIATTPLAAVSKPVASQRLPVLARRVPWAEVSAKVFHDTCWHCHAVPDFARGDGGPGNSGGFGFAPRGLDVSSYTGISGGAFGPDGERRSIFERIFDASPALRGTELFDASPAFHGNEVLGAALRGTELFDASPAFHANEVLDASPALRGTELFDASPAFHGNEVLDASPALRGTELFDASPAFHGNEVLDASPSRPPLRGNEVFDTPRVVAHLMARHVEASGGSVDGIRGMPLGLPALSLEQIQLVESWIVQGRPQ